MPYARLCLTLATAAQALASACIILGLWVPWATLVLIAFPLLVTPVFHNFWNFEGDQRFAKRVSFRINVIALGGLFALLSASL